MAEMLNHKEWIIYLICLDRSRTAVGLFFGNYSSNEEFEQLIKGGNTTIKVLMASGEQCKDKLSVLHASNLTMFKIVPNRTGISAAFAEEKGYVYFFEASARHLVCGKVRKNGQTDAYEGRHSLCIDGSGAFITIRNGLVVIDCISGDFYFDQTLPNYYSSQMDIEFPQHPRGLTTDTVSVPIEQRKRVCVPRNSRTNSHLDEYVIYYTLASNVRQPIATLMGRIRAQIFKHHFFEGRTNYGTLTTVLLNINDSDLVRDAAIVRHSNQLIVVSANGSAVVKVYDYRGVGFEFGSDSVLKINGKLIVSKTATEELPISGISSLTVKSGSVSVFICDKNQVILLDEGLNNYCISRMNDQLRASERNSGQRVRSLIQLYESMPMNRRAYGPQNRISSSQRDGGHKVRALIQKFERLT